MFRFITRYPLTLICVAAVWYLSMYRVQPPPVHLFSWFDKLVHFCMYGAISSLVWFEHWRAHAKTLRSHAALGAIVCPIVMGGLVELAQAYLTTYRTGDWFDFIANSLGVCAASAIAWAIYTYAHKWK